jgi:hypothetical protein
LRPSVSCSRHLFEPQRSEGELCRAGRKTVQRGESGTGAKHRSRTS